VFGEQQDEEKGSKSFSKARTYYLRCRNAVEDIQLQAHLSTKQSLLVLWLGYREVKRLSDNY
jgi:hypothetical protein